MGSASRSLWDNPLGTDGFEFVEYAAPDPAALGRLFEQLGFTAIAKHRSKNVLLYRQGEINFIVNAEPGSFAQAFARVHGPSICAIAFRVKDAAHAYNTLVQQGAWGVEAHPGPMELNIPAIKGIGDSLIYLQPVYLQSQQSAFPEFQRIIVASPREVVWGETLAEALDLLLEAEGSGPTPTEPPSPTPTPTPVPGETPGPTPTVEPGDALPNDVPGLIDYANRHFELAQTALRDGDFARYGEEIDKVKAALQRLDELAPGLSAGSAAPSASPAP